MQFFLPLAFALGVIITMAMVKNGEMLRLLRWTDNRVRKYRKALLFSFIMNIIFPYLLYCNIEKLSFGIYGITFCSLMYYCYFYREEIVRLIMVNLGREKPLNAPDVIK